MLAAPYNSSHFIYALNHRQHPMHSPHHHHPLSPYPSSPLPHIDQSGVAFPANWHTDTSPRYGPGTVSAFPPELSKSHSSQSNLFSSSSQTLPTHRAHYPSYSSSERSTVHQPFHQGWPSPTLSPQSVHTPALTASSASNQLYQTPFGRNVDIASAPSSEWQWRDNENSSVLGLGATSSTTNTNTSSVTTTTWSGQPGGDLRVPSAPFSSPSFDDLLYAANTPSTSSPTYSVTDELPPMYQISPDPSPSPSPSLSSHKRSPKPRASPSRSSDGSAPAKQCSHCHATSTPLWRREPMTNNTLCNACGLYLQQRHRHRPKELIEADLDDESEDEEDQNYSGPECSHCHTHRTSVWRRSKTGAQLCNACGVYARLRGKDRPLSLKRKKIKPRTKHASRST